MHSLLRHLRLGVLACTALALSAGLAFAATPPDASTGLANAAAHAGKTVPVVTEEETTVDETSSEDETEATETETTETETTETETTETDTTESETTDSTDEVADTEDSADNCTVDPTALTPEELAAMNHGSVVCWAAQQTEWPTWFSNHGAFVRCWAHQGKADAASCTEDPATVAATGGDTTGADATEDSAGDSTGDQAPRTHGNASGHGHGKAKGKLKHQG